MDLPGNAHPRALALIALPALCLLGCRKPEVPPPKLEVLSMKTAGELGARVSAAAAGPGQLLAAGTPLGAVLLRGPEGTQALGEKPVHDGPVSALAWSSDGKHLLSVGGKVAAWWDVAGRRLVRKVSGPQTITAAAIDAAPEGDQAYFGTAQGAMVRWDPSQSRAVPLPRMACPAWPVAAARRSLADDKRCPFGTVVESDRGGAACVYPVTVVAVLDHTLVQACREGALYLRDPRSGGSEGFSPGHLTAVAALPGERLLLGRADGELRVYQRQTRELWGALEPGGAPSAAASGGGIIAAAQPGAIHLWVGEARRASGSVPAARPVVWLELRSSPLELRFLTDDGRLSLVQLRPPGA